MIADRIVSPGTKPWLDVNSTFICAIAEYVIVLPDPITDTVGAERETAG